MAGVSRAARFLESRSRLLASLYCLAIILIAAAFIAYGFWAPRTVDQGVAILGRSLAFQWTFRPVVEAQHDLRRGDLDSAEVRLTRFIARNASAQQSQLMTRALIDAHETLAQVFSRQGRLGRARDTLADLTALVPLHYRAWLIRGRAESRTGDLEAAQSSMSQAFLLSLNNHEVVESYLEVLAEVGDFERILWVEDQFRRADRRAMPTAEVKLGVRRARWQAYLLSKAGIPIEHARFFRLVEIDQLERGPDRWLRLPLDALSHWPDDSSHLVVQTRFEHVVEGLRIEGVRFKSRAGDTTTLDLEPASVRYLHIPHSSSRYYAEFELPIEPNEVASLEIRFASPQINLSSGALAIIDKARTNLAVSVGST